MDKENGLNEVLEMTLNSLMYSERQAFLGNEHLNKGNGYRFGKVFGRGKQLELRVARDHLGQFYPVLLALLRDQDTTIHDLSFALYSKSLPTRDIGNILDLIYGKHYSKSTISSIHTGFYEQAVRKKISDSLY